MKSPHAKRKNCKFIDSTNEILKSFHTHTPRRTRIKLTEAQLNALEDSFNDSHHPSAGVKEELGKSLDIPMKNIQIWFQNRRARKKAENEALQTKYERKMHNAMRRNEGHYFKKYNDGEFYQYYGYLVNKNDFDGYDEDPNFRNPYQIFDNDQDVFDYENGQHYFIKDERKYDGFNSSDSYRERKN